MRKAYMTPEELSASLSKLPRISLANLPTPLEECTRLSQAVSQPGDGPRILIKRDDLTGQALGGNKVRHLEFRIADALAKGCDTYIYVGAGNASRSTAAACAKAGLGCVILEKGHPPAQGNLLLCQLLGAEIHYLDPESKEATPSQTVSAQRESPPPLEKIRALADRLREEGHVPYSDHLLAFRPVSAVCSYLLATLELQEQLSERGVQRAHIYIVNGRGHAGLHLGAKLLGLPWRITGVAVGQDFEIHRLLSKWSEQTAEHLKLPVALSAEEIDTTFDFEGDGFGVPNEVCMEAMALAARTESIILDPTYTGKAMAGLIDHIRTGRIGHDETVVFIHTGGTPIVFEFADTLSRYLETRPAIPSAR